MTFRTRLEHGTYAFGRAQMWFYLRVLHGLQVTGIEHVPKEGGVLIAGNHPSLLDPMAILVTAPRPVHFVTAEVMYTFPPLAWWLRGAGMIRVEREKGAAGAFMAAFHALSRGEVVGIFPHGRLVREYEKAVPKDGAIQLAARAGVPIIPAYCEGTELPGRTLLSRIGKQMAIAYGEPYEVKLTRPELKDDAKVKAATWELMRRIVGLKGIAKNLTQAAQYRPIAPFEHLIRTGDEHPGIWESQAGIR